MPSRRERSAGRGTIDLLEEGIDLLRGCPLHVLAAYYLGSLPFVLGLLVFWAELSQTAVSASRLVPVSLGMALLFVWMRCWQAVFARQLLARVHGEEPPRWSPDRVLRLAATQTALQPLALFLLPWAALLLFPLGWAVAFFQNVTVLGDGEAGRTRAVAARAARLAAHWPKQGVLLVAMMLLIGLFLFVNIRAALLQGLALAKSLTGLETPFTRYQGNVMNTTFLATCLGLTYLCLDPLVRAVYALRAFYSGSRASGADLLAELRRLASPATARLILPVVLAAAAGAVSVPAVAGGEGAPPAGPEARLSADRLDESIERVLQRRRYRWRAPPRQELRPEDDGGWLNDFVDGVGSGIQDAYRATRDWVGGVRDWIDEQLDRLAGDDAERAGADGRSAASFWLLLAGFLLLAATTSALAVLAARAWRRRGQGAAVAASAAAVAPDLGDEAVTPDLLTEDGWLRLAAEQMEGGDPRLALRALYLACLSFLAGRGHIKVARFKSNQDYERELRRRTRGSPALHAAFSNGVRVFDRAWYGMHAVTPEILHDFRSNLDSLRGAGR